MTHRERTIAVVGPTASGKSTTAIVLAQTFGERFNGGAAIIGADSRQVYRHMDLGSGKEPGTLTTNSSLPPRLRTFYNCEGVRHYMIDIVAPTTPYNCAKFVREARRVMEALSQEHALPIICGGTHFWVQSLIENATFPHVAPNAPLRKALAQKDTHALLAILSERDPHRARHIIAKNEQNNRHRLIRAIEIAEALGAVPIVKSVPPNPQTTLILAVAPPMKRITQNITQRLAPRLNAGMCDEIRALHSDYGVSWKRLESFGLEYLWVTRYIRGHCSREAMCTGIIADSRRFAKRQLTWLRRWERSGARIHWITSADAACNITRDFLTRDALS